MMPDDPSCLAIASIQDSLFAIAGSRSCRLQFFSVNPDIGLSPASDEPLLDNPRMDPFQICESLVVLSGTSTSFSPISETKVLLCGLRTGRMIAFCIRLIDGALNLERIEEFTIGHAVVQITPDDMHSNSAFIICGEDFYRFQLSADKLPSKSLTNVFLTDQSNVRVSHLS